MQIPATVVTRSRDLPRDVRPFRKGARPYLRLRNDRDLERMRTHASTASVAVGVDDSTHSEAAVRWAVAYAGPRHLPLLLVNAAGRPGTAVSLSARDEERHRARIRSRRVTDHALALARGLSPGVDVSVSNPRQDAPVALLDLSGVVGMIVVGTRGRGPLRSLVLGSVSLAVASRAACPTTIAHAPEGATVLGTRAPVVVALESDDGSSTLAFAFDLASHFGRPLVAAHPARFGEREQPVEELLAGYAEKHPEVDVHRYCYTGIRAGRLVDLSARAAHLVLARPGLGRHPAIPEPVHHVLERARCPVTLVPEPSLRPSAE